MVTLIAFAVKAENSVETKVCTVFHENRATNCISSEKKNYPTGVIYGVSKVKDKSTLEHRWNGKSVEPMAVISKGAILVSSFEIATDFNGEIVFSVHDSNGLVINQNTYIINRSSFAITAQEKLAIVEVAEANPPPSTEPKKIKLEMNEMYIPAKGSPQSANPSAQKALEAQLLDEKLDRENKSGSDHQAEPILSTKTTNHLLRFELHGVYVTQKKLGKSATAIAYWVPEFEITPNILMGLRLGGTQWKEQGEKNFTAFEGDVHTNFKFDSSKGSLTVQPLAAYHSWAHLGQQISFGGNLVWQQSKSNLSFLTGFQFWKHKDVSYQWFNLGIGVEF